MLKDKFVTKQTDISRNTVELHDDSIIVEEKHNTSGIEKYCEGMRDLHGSKHASQASFGYHVGRVPIVAINKYKQECGIDLMGPMGVEEKKKAWSRFFLLYPEFRTSNWKL